MARVELNIVALGDFKSVNSQIAALKAQVDALNKSLAGTGLSSNLIKELNAAHDAFKATMLSTGQFTQQTVKLKSETDKFGEALVGGKLKLNEYFDIIKRRASLASSQLRALAVEQTKLQNSLVISDPTKQGVFSVYTPTKINEISNATKIATNMQNLYNIAVNKGTQSLINWGKNTQWAGRQLTVGLTVPMVMFGATSMKTFQEVNDQLVRLQKVYGSGLTQPTAKALAEVKSQTIGLAKELASSWGVAAKDTAAMAADIAATGKTGTDLISATREAMRLSKLGELDTQQAMQATISLQNVYKISTQELGGAVNFLNAVENQTSTSLQDLVDGIPRVGPIVAQLGGSFKDTAVMMVAMKEAGVPAAQSANAIKSALASLINPSKAATEAFAKYNINLPGIATATKGNPVQMIMMLQKSLQGLEPLAKAQLIERLFGKFQQARVSALIENLGALNSQTKTAFDLVNATAPQLASIAAKELSVATESTTGKFKRAVETIKADLIPVGEKVMQIATKLLEFGDAVGKAFGSLPSPVKSLFGLLAGGVALAGPLIMLTGVMANFVGYLLRGMFGIKNLITGTKTLGELLTPNLIASQQAAQLFSTEIVNDVDAVNLMNQAIKQLTTTLEGLAVAMSAATGTEIAAAAANATRIMTPSGMPSLPLPMYAGGEEARKLIMAHTGGALQEAIPFNEIQKSLTKDGIMIAGEEKKLSRTVMKLFEKIQAGIEKGQIIASEVSIGFLNNSITRQSELFNSAARSGGGGMERSLFLQQENFAGRWAVQGDLAVKRGTIKLDETMSRAIAAVDTQLNKLTETILLDDEFAKRMGVSFEKVDDQVLALVHSEAITRLEKGVASGAITFEGVDREAALFLQQIRLSEKELSEVTFNIAGEAALTGSAARSIIGGYGANQSTQRRATAQTKAQGGMSYSKLDSEEIRITQAKIRQIILEEGMITREQVVAQYRETAHEMADALVEEFLIDSGLITDAAAEAGVMSANAYTTAMQKRIIDTLPEELSVVALKSAEQSAGVFAEAALIDESAWSKSFTSKMNVTLPATLSTLALKSAEESAAAFIAAGVLSKEAFNLGFISAPSIGPMMGPLLPNGQMKLRRGEKLYNGEVIPKKLGMGLGMGIGMGAMMAGPMVSGIGGGKNEAANIGGSVLSNVGMASMIAMIAPEFAIPIMAGVAALTLAYKGVEHLIKVEKEQKAMAQSAWKSSSDIATYFGNSVVNTDTQTSDFNVTLIGTENHVRQMGKSLSISSKEVSNFKAMIDALPKDNPLSQFITGLINEKNPEKIKQLILTFVDLQVAIGQIKPEQAQKTIDLILSASNHTALIGSTFSNFKNQTQAVIETLKNASGDTTKLGDSLTQLIASAANTSSLESLKAILDGMAQSGLNTAAAFDAISRSYIAIGNIKGAQISKALSHVRGANQTDIALLEKAANLGFQETISSKTEIEKLRNKAYAFIEKNIGKQSSSTNIPGVSAINNQTDTLKSQNKEYEKNIKTLEKKKKIVDDELKAQQKITDELKKQHDFEASQADLQTQIKEAQIRGNYLQAANLKQQMMNKAADFAAQKKLTPLEDQSAKLQAQIDKLKLKIDDNNTAIDKNTSALDKASAAYSASIDNKGNIAVANEGKGTASNPFTDSSSKDILRTQYQEYVDSSKALKLKPVAYEKWLTKDTASSSDPANSKDLTVRKNIYNYENKYGLAREGQYFVMKGSDGKTYKFKMGKDSVTRIGNPYTQSIEMPSIADHNPNSSYAMGGLISGSGTGTSDSIPAYLSHGEYVVKASSVNKYGMDFFDSLNAGHFANGGSVKKQNWFQKYVSGFSSKNTPAAEMFGISSLLRLIAGQGKSGDALSASMVPLNFMGMGGGKSLFLGMPRGIKALQEARNAEKIMQGIHAAIEASEFKKLPVTKLGEQLESTLGKSFPVSGIGGLYKGANGTKEFIKPVTDSLSGLSEIRSNQIARDVQGLNTPIQELIKIMDPSDPKGKRTLLALRSAFNPEFANPTGKFTKDEYFRQLVSSLLRGDKDLQKANLSGNNLVDAGTSGVFNLASGIRELSKSMPSMKEQAAINLLGVKGGAKRWFAESTASIAKSMTPKDYHDAIIAEIKREIPLLEKTIASFKLTDPDQITAYANMINRLKAGAVEDWSSFQSMAASVVPATAKTPTAASIAKKAEELALRKRQSGHAVGFSDIMFKGQLGGYANGGMINAPKYSIPSFDVGTNYVPGDMIAQIHKGERIIPAYDNNTNSSNSVYNINMTINGGNANANDIANQVMSKLQVINAKNNKTNMVRSK